MKDGPLGASISLSMIRITPSISIKENEIQEEFILASGPGGQNVNKVATAVKLRFDAAQSPSLPEDVRDRLMRLAGKRLTDEGVIVIHARRFRSQDKNRQDAKERLASLIREAAQQPKRRRKTQPTAASIERRLEDKRRRSQIKRVRRSTSDESDD
jgi:ribosome-associated protein